MTRPNRRDFLKAAGAGGAVAVAGCLGDGGENEISLGVLMGVSGGLEELGPDIRDSALIVEEQFSDADTDITIDTQFEDTGSEASTGVSGAEALDDAGYPAIIGALASNVSLQVAQEVAIPQQIPMVSPASTAPEYSELEGDWTFRTAVPDSFQGEVLAQIAGNRLEADSVAALGQDDAYGQGLSGAFVESFRNDIGGSASEPVIFAQGESSYTTQLENALEDDPDVLLIVGFPEDGVRIFSDFYSEFDADSVDILVADGLQDSGLPSDVGYDMSDVTGTAPIGSGPGVDAFEQLFEDTYDESPAGKPFVRQSYDAAATLLLAAAAADDSSDSTAIRDQIRNVTEEPGEEVTPDNLVEGAEMANDGDDIQYRGVSGEITYDENGDQSDVAYEYFTFTEDGLETIETIQL
ncbi:MAG: ABC-type branched-subunit amino acid transport system substrate-binding protein [Natronomonas sp.]|jgi:ABC-type branched-subunit amino acid transport system substrate-binding protein